MKGKKFAIRQAKKLLSQCGFNPDNIDIRRAKDFSTNLEQISDALEVKVIEHSFSDNISGVFFKKDGKLFLGVNSNHHEHRRRFTIAHEIGHYILHSAEVLHYDKSDPDKIYLRADNVLGLDEVEANHFAAELLLPEKLLLKCIENNILSIKDLAERFNVSEDTMRYRLTNLGYL